jgi:hypothetical protein
MLDQLLASVAKQAKTTTGYFRVPSRPANKAALAPAREAVKG